MNVDFLKDTAIFIVQREDGVYMELMEVSEGQTDNGSSFVYRLDRRITEADVTIVYDSASVTSDITLPYPVSTQAEQVVAVRSDSPDGRPEATSLNVVSATGNTITVSGDASSANLYIGEDYRFQYTFSEFVLKKQAKGGGLATITGGRLQVNKLYVTFDRTGYFRAEVSAKNRGTYTYPYTGKQLGTSTATIGKPSVSDGTFGFRVNSRSTHATITLINDNFLPCYFTAAEWEGRYERRTSRA